MTGDLTFDQLLTSIEQPAATMQQWIDTASPHHPTSTVERVILVLYNHDNTLP